MKLLQLLPAFMAAYAAQAHFTMQYIWVNGVSLIIYNAYVLNF